MLPWFQYLTYHIGPMPIQVWGSFVALGIGMGMFIACARARRSGQNAQLILDAGLWIVIAGLIGARVFHILYEPAFYFAHPFEIIKVWQGGMSSYGSFLGAGIGLLLFARVQKISKLYLYKMIDVFAYGALFGWIIGRVGCFMIHDHLGKPCDCFLAIQTPDGPRLDMAFLEILALLPLALIFFIFRKKQKPQGWFASVLFLYYGITRFILDFFRATDIPNADARYFGLTPAQYFSIVAVAVSLTALMNIRAKHKA